MNADGGEPLAVPSPVGRSGRRVILAIVVGVPLVLVPLLLSGRVSRREVCLNTLAMRESADLSLGSLRVARLSARELDEWPAPPTHPHLLDRFGPLPSATPSEWHRAMGAAEGTVFMDAERTLPLAFVMEIPNRRALAPSRAAIVEVRLLAAATLDPSDEGDRACWQRLDGQLRRGLDRLAHLTRRERRRPPVTPAEEAAQRILARCLDAADAEELRAALCEEVPES